jgi:Fur family ferric uptake transcriptional regulator
MLNGCGFHNNQNMCYIIFNMLCLVDKAAIIMNEKIAQIIKGAGLKYTQGRAALLGVLMETLSPLTQEELSLRLRDIGLNRVTIYRALESFLKAGLVHRVDNGDRVWKFAYCGCGSRKHCHPHFVCRSCGKVECLVNVALPEIPDMKLGYCVEERELYLRGLCDRCSSKLGFIES